MYEEMPLLLSRYSNAKACKGRRSRARTLRPLQCSLRHQAVPDNQGSQNPQYTMTSYHRTVLFITDYIIQGV
jgi:hypothetical protein